MNKHIIVRGLGCSLLLLLSGCVLNKQQKNDEAIVDENVLVMQGGKPILTVSEFKKFVDEAVGSDPQMRFMAQMMPDFEEQLFERAKLSEIVLNEWAKKVNIGQDEEYKKMRAQAEKALDTMLQQKFFIKKHVGEVTDSDAQKYYDTNKTQDPSLMMSPEGVEAKGLSFEKEADAKNFLTKVHDAKGDIEKVAKELKKDLEDLGLVSQMSMIDPTVKDKVLETKKTPNVLPVIKASDKEFWVVKAYKHQKVQYMPFEQAKERIKETLMNKSIEEAFEKKIPQYQKEYGIEINRIYFEQKHKEREEQQAQIMGAIKEKKEEQKDLSTQQDQAKELVEAQPVQKIA